MSGILDRESPDQVLGEHSRFFSGIEDCAMTVLATTQETLKSRHGMRKLAAWRRSQGVLPKDIHKKVMPENKWTETENLQRLLLQ